MEIVNTIDSAISITNKPMETVNISIPEIKEALDKMTDMEWLDLSMTIIERSLQKKSETKEAAIGSRATFDEAELKRRAESFFNSHPELSVSDLKTRFLDLIAPFLEKVQAEYRRGEIAAYNKRGIKEVFEDIDSVIGDMMNDVEGDAPERVKAALTVNALYCYPSYRLNKNLGDTELAFISVWFFKKNYELTIENAKILSPILEQVFCRRETTIEYEKQTKVFAAVYEAMTILAKKAKDYDAREIAKPLLKARQILDKRHDRYTESLTESQAEAIIAAYEKAKEDLELEIAYQEL